MGGEVIPRGLELREQVGVCVAARRVVRAQRDVRIERGGEVAGGIVQVAVSGRERIFERDAADRARRLAQDLEGRGRFGFSRQQVGTRDLQCDHEVDDVVAYGFEVVVAGIDPGGRESPVASADGRVA